MRTKMRTRTRHRLYLGGAYALMMLTVAATFFDAFLRLLAQGAGMIVRGAGVIAVALGLVGCSTISFTSTTPLYEVAVAEKVSTPVAPKATAPTTVGTAVASMRHGRFIVEVGENEHVIEGGVFTPPKDMLVKSTAAHVLISNYTTKELLYYRRTKTGSYEPVIGYAVVTPKPEELPDPEVRGQVTRIDTKPVWCPGKEARKKYPKLPAGCLPFGHKDNAMGAAKFEIKWQGVKGWDAIRIHGAIGYSMDGAFWNEETLGCTRLQDSAILALIDLLGPQAVKEGIEVVLERGNTLQRHAL